jgi:tetratricopeptide (TPR) repeat protein
VLDTLRAFLSDSRTIRLGLIAVAVLVAVGALALGGWAWWQSQQAQGAMALAAATDLAQAAQAPGASPAARAAAIQALEAVIAQHPRYAGVPQAAYRLGNLRYAAGEYAAARGAYQVALAQGASGTVRTLAAVGIGYTWEAEKDLAKAQTAYEAALTGLAPTDFLYEGILLDLARVQEFGGRREAAIATYQRLLKDVPDSRRGDDVRTRIASLQSSPPTP